MITEAECERAEQALAALQEAIASVIVGHEQIVCAALIGLLCEGNVLLEGIPGLGKTLLVRALASALGLRFSRIQFTPDLMPADIVGTDIITEESGRRTFTFSRGPVFANIVLADEINRATPKTQSALLEAMEERTVTVGTSTYDLEEPFLVLATQNPIEMEGTYPLPEAQVDRFMLKAILSYPSLDEMVAIAERNTEGEGIVLPQAVASADEIFLARRAVWEMPIGAELRRYIVRLVLATHPAHPLATGGVRDFVEYGASPRAAIALVRAAKAHAFLAGEGGVRRADIEAVFPMALQHRMILNFRGEAEGVSTASLLDEVWSTTKVT
ncbi:MAG: AAA family ATPase [Candidatus Bipolaricaulota bacterium]|nr:MAG: AAA family ATPase [Candidatus Bipolaricaulota bacterium]